MTAELGEKVVAASNHMKRRLEHTSCAESSTHSDDQEAADFSAEEAELMGTIDTLGRETEMSKTLLLSLKLTLQR